jgi:hypothetical protein
MIHSTIAWFNVPFEMECCWDPREMSESASFRSRVLTDLVLTPASAAIVEMDGNHLSQYQAAATDGVNWRALIAKYVRECYPATDLAWGISTNSAIVAIQYSATENPTQGN